VSDLLAKHVRAKREKDDDEKDELLSDQEKGARQKIIDGAKEAGATLDRPDARGGLPPSLVLGAFRRDKFACTDCGSQKDIGPHHIGGIPDTKKKSLAGHKNKLSNISTLCVKCHDKEHNKAREEGLDSSQVLPKGDVGTDRDHGDKPVARV